MDITKEHVTVVSGRDEVKDAKSYTHGGQRTKRRHGS